MLSDAMNLKIFLFYLLIVNIICLALFGLDKRRAQTGAWRIPERDLFLWAIVGGSLGGWLGMQLFRHKTQHLKFKLGFPLIIVLQLGLLYYLNR